MGESRNSGLGRSQAVPRINVTYRGPADQAKFAFTGSGFLPGRQVRIRAVNNGNLASYSFHTTANSEGKADITIGFAVLPGQDISFAATDGRGSQSDQSGVLWSNTVTVQTH
ncbi:hypothetical protein ACTWPT_46535 [Nonomuraea sp. 3N208]|uniref:hypothetical protein n=1 Tax=Nonomuraea sp. 3N208 TaxID=3457421 RepID=UPI003FCF972D